MTTTYLVSCLVYCFNNYCLTDLPVRHFILSKLKFRAQIIFIAPNIKRDKLISFDFDKNGLKLAKFSDRIPCFLA